MRPRLLSAAFSLFAASFPALAGGGGGGDGNLPPFDFSDQFYLANGIDPNTIVGRPNGTPPNSVIDNRENGPDFNNVRILQHVAAYDDSGHPIFFYVTGLPSLASFTDNAAGEEALEIAETYQVYEFPRAGNPQFAVFPKRQDLIADLRNGYFSNDPLGTWRINLVRFTEAAFNTDEGREELAELAERNGLDLDGTPLIRTVGEVEDLADEGFATVEIPPMEGAPGVFRWFFCPVIGDPRDGAIAPDAHLEVVDIPAADEFIRLFTCLQRFGEEECDLGPCVADHDRNGIINSDDFFEFIDDLYGGDDRADLDNNGVLNSNDYFAFLNAFFNPGPGCL